MAPLIHCLQGDDRFDNHVVVTGQHRDLLDTALSRLNLHPTINLHVMNDDSNLNQLVAKMLQGMDEALRDIKPDCVLVHGDTATAMATAIATYHYKIPVVHVEAGLRTDDRYSPWPEEGNRRLIAAIANLHCAPTTKARLNLLHEGIFEADIVMCGNTVVDALFAMMHRLDHDVRLQHELQQQFAYLPPSRPLILVTGHRRESFGEGFFSHLFSIALHC